MYDIFNSESLDLFVNIIDMGTAPRIRTYLYLPNFVVEIPNHKNPIIDNLTLAQNYPNPFSGLTIIKFNLPKSIRISLAIYDITGKEVIKLINNQIYSPGEHEIAWNGKNQNGREVSSGIHLYQLKAGEKLFIKEMMLIK